MCIIVFVSSEQGSSPVFPGSNAPWDFLVVCGKDGMRISPVSGTRLRVLKPQLVNPQFNNVSQIVDLADKHQTHHHI
jgi:hypothetical protein